MNQSASDMLCPLPAASVWKTFHKLSRLLYFSCWLVSLPTEVVLHGKIGKRYANTLFFIVEADDVNAIHKFLWPGFRRCTAVVTPVSEVPVPKD